MARTHAALDAVRAAEKRATAAEVIRKGGAKAQGWFKQAESELFTEFFNWCDQLKCAYIVTEHDEGEYQLEVKVEPGPKSKLNSDTLAEINRRAAALSDFSAAQARADSMRNAYERRKLAKWAEQTPSQRLMKGWSSSGLAEALVPVTVGHGQDDSISSLVCSGLAHAEFSIGRGLLMTFTTGHGATQSVDKPARHGIAILKVAEGKYSIFDPNLGVYSVERTEKLIGAVILLLVDGYNKRTVDKLDDWTVYCKTVQAVPQRQPAQSGALEDAYVARDQALVQMQGFIQKKAKEAFERIDAYRKAADNVKKQNELWSAYEAAQAQKKSYAEESKEWKAADDRTERLLNDLKPYMEGPPSPLQKFAEDMALSCLKIRFDIDPSGGQLRFNDAQVDRFWRAKGGISASPLAELAKLLEQRV